VRDDGEPVNAMMMCMEKIAEKYGVLPWDFVKLTPYKQGVLVGWVLPSVQYDLERYWKEKHEKEGG